jgi:hypothetical protein
MIRKLYGSGFDLKAVIQLRANLETHTCANVIPFGSGFGLPYIS